MDAARSARGLDQRKVYVVYRRSEDELPARLEEYHHALEEGIKTKFLTILPRFRYDDGFLVR
jgi:glutamate synthase (NADPH/NADH) small chain